MSFWVSQPSHDATLQSDLEITQGLEDDESLMVMEEAQARIVSEWRQKWLAQVFVHMVPRTKWKSSERNIQLGDIGHLHYDRKLGPDSWRLVKVTEVKPDSQGVVRTIRVCYRSRHSSDLGKKYKTRKQDKMEVGMQRFAVLLPVEEQVPGSGEVEEILDTSKMT